MANKFPIYVLGTGTVSPNGIQQEAFSSNDDAPTLSNCAGLTNYIAKRNLRRVDHFSRLALYASCLALDDAGLWGTDLTNTGIALTSGYGAAQTTFNFLDSFLEDSDKVASPTHFSSGLHNAASAYISMYTKAQGPCVCTSNVGLGFAYSLTTALYWLQEGIVNYALVGGADEYCQVLEHCVSRFQSDEEGKCLSKECTAGEGAAFLVLGTKPAHTACSVSSPVISQLDDNTLPTSLTDLYTAPLGLAHQEAIYAKLAHRYGAKDTLSQIGSHPSALAFASVQAVQDIWNGNATEATAFALDQLDKYALLTFSS